MSASATIATLAGLVVTLGAGTASASPVGPGTAQGTATCSASGVSISASATGLVSQRGENNPNGYYQGGTVVSDDVSTQFTPLTGTDAYGNVTFPAFTYVPGGSASATFYVDSTTSSGGVDLPFTVDFPTCNATPPPPPPVDNGPHAAFKALPMPSLGLVVNFDGSSSTGTAPLQYLWDFGDATTVNNNVVTPGNHTYAQPGTYHVTLTITDASGRSVTASADILVASQTKLALSPNKGVRAGGTEKVAIAVTNADGTPVANANVVVKVSGANQVSGIVTTDAAGRVTFNYRASNVGRDKIAVTANGVSASTTASILRPREMPTLTATVRHGQVYAYVQTHPSVSDRKITVYYVYKVRGHKATLRAAGQAITASNGRVRVTLQLPAGKNFTLKARMSGNQDFIEKLSAPVTVLV